jgi:hypothetical protein
MALSGCGPTLIVRGDGTLPRRATVVAYAVMESLVLALAPYQLARTTHLLNGASALETDAMSHLRDFAEPLWQSKPHGPPALQVLRDWLEERGEKPDHATLARMLCSRDARRQSKPT